MSWEAQGLIEAEALADRLAVETANLKYRVQVAERERDEALELANDREAVLTAIRDSTDAILKELA